MGSKKSKRIKIPKSRDIVYGRKKNEKVQIEDTVLKSIEEKREKFVQEIVVTDPALERKFSHYLTRKDAQKVDENKKEEYQEIIRKMKNEEER